jgi:hypothetical protein
MQAGEVALQFAVGLREHPSCRGVVGRVGERADVGVPHRQQHR